MFRRILSAVLACLLLSAAVPAAGEDVYGAFEESAQRALDALERRLDASLGYVDVYSDANAPGNHFTQKARMSGVEPERVHEMQENCTVSPRAGSTCIRCAVDIAGDDWGGWMFLSGYIGRGDTAPRLNDGRSAGQGISLKGMDRLVFFARGERGGEQVEFFTAGFGRDPYSGLPTVAYPDSAPQLTTGYVTLSRDWQRYEIDLSGADLSCVGCGFGFVMSGLYSGTGEQVFYLDEIRFEGSGAYAHPLLASYDTDDPVLADAAYTYDNALAAMAFLAAGRTGAAARILDSFVYAAAHDRYKPGRLRNAYRAGDITGEQAGGARLPGWDGPEGYCEDSTQVGVNTGNTAFAALALLQYAAHCWGAPEYVALARTLMDRVIEECSDGTPGFTAGCDGWPEAGQAAVTPLTYKSTEHNIDAYAVFARLYTLTGEEKYRAAAESALTFVLSMYDADEGRFYTGTRADGVTPDTGTTVLDAQVWAALALGESFAPCSAVLTAAERCRTAEGGYGFTVTDGARGWWAEGTAFTALMYRLRGEEGKAAAALTLLEGAQTGEGLFCAASRDGMPTGLYLSDGSPWTYSRTPHIAPAAWYVLAVYGFDPYVF